jgi:hypothetical protein
MVLAPLPLPMGGVEIAVEQLLGSRVRRSNKERGYISPSDIKCLLVLCLKILQSFSKDSTKLAYCPIGLNKTGYPQLHYEVRRMPGKHKVKSWE